MRRVLTGTVLAVATAAAWMLLLPAAPVAQPFAFDHSRHGAMACVTCHTGAAAQQHAQLPSLELCDRCHATEPRANLREMWAAPRRDVVPWQPVTRIADHAMFSHRRHVGIAGLECSSCHGDVRGRTTPLARPPIRLDMDGCLSCHRQEGASQDCIACHR